MGDMELRMWGDPVLRTATRAVVDFGAELRAELAQMGETMDRASGAGLAAPQVGSARRLFVCRFGEEGPLRAFVNPRLTWASAERETGLEGCLSIPRVAVAVERAVAVTVVAQNGDGEERTVHAEGPDAVVLQHELDHLDGLLMLDRAAPAERRRALRELVAAQYLQSK